VLLHMESQCAFTPAISTFDRNIEIHHLKTILLLDITYLLSIFTLQVLGVSYDGSPPKADMVDSALKAAKAVDLAAVKEELDDFPPPDLDEAAIYMRTDQIICAAASSGHAEMVKWLLETRFPAYVAHLHAHLAAIQGGPDVYEAFLQKWPHLINYELGHNGNPIGLSVFGNDMPMVKFVLGRGVDPNTAQYSHREVGLSSLK
jgi:hypothetical protein